MPPPLIACRGVGERRLLGQMATVLDPLAAQYRGATEATVRPALRQAWYTAFGTHLPEPTQSRCIAAITAGHPWQIALWSND
jgi:hypothetical protein